jgi:hypothetical protein
MLRILMVVALLVGASASSAEAQNGSCGTCCGCNNGYDDQGQTTGHCVEAEGSGKRGCVVTYDSLGQKCTPIGESCSNGEEIPQGLALDGSRLNSEFDGSATSRGGLGLPAQTEYRIVSSGDGRMLFIDCSGAIVARRRSAGAVSSPAASIDFVAFW